MAGRQSFPGHSSLSPLLLLLAPALMLAISAGGAVGCRSAPLARHRVRGRTILRSIDDVPVRGFATQLRFRAGDRDRDIKGELIAVDPTHVWLLQRGRTYGIDRRLVREMTIYAFSSRGSWMGLWTGLGAASSLSHGYFATISLPTWLGFGIPFSVAAGRDARVKVPLSWISRACQFARFPMGLPARWPRGSVHGRRARPWAQIGCGARSAIKRRRPPTRPAPFGSRAKPASRPASRPASQPAPRPTRPRPTPSKPAPPIDDDPKLGTP